MSTSASVEGSRVGRVIMRPLLPASLAANPSPPPLPPPSPLLLPPPGGGAATHSEAEAEAIISVDSDTVVILASLLCALICVAGLALVARCTCRRSQSSSTTGGQAQAQEAPRAAKRGLKKAAIEALPTMTMSASLESEAECAICLAAFGEGDELRLLPHCAHAFHAACIDTWLAAHASCPSCRSTVLLTCRSCAAATAASHPLFTHDKDEESTSFT